MLQRYSDPYGLPDEEILTHCRYIRCHLIHLNSLEFLFEHPQLGIDDGSVNIILDQILPNNKDTMLVRRQCVYFLDRLSKHTMYDVHLIPPNYLVIRHTNIRP